MSERKNRPKKFKKRSQDSSSSSSSSLESTSSLSSDDESNARDLKPIKEYLADRKELARQLFIAVKGDKLRMMLPQDLKKMELAELEEWCANELSGMSKARILSILNGQPMVQSSDSNDTDDSGPSLEIISDTEEWGDVSDGETISKEEESLSKKSSGTKKDKSKSKIRSEKASKDKDKEKARGKFFKGKIKCETDTKLGAADLAKVKKETEPTDQVKEKDGESLLDLLELEMRARAIRALIRKEEDIIPNNPSGSSVPQTSANTNQSSNSKSRARDPQLSLKVVQDKLDELDNSFNRNVGKNKAAQDLSEEEDVVLVLQPTTTIELISSESEAEGGQGKRRSQKFQNERDGLKNPVTEDAKDSKIQEDSEKNKSEDPKITESKTDDTSATNSEAQSVTTKVLPSEEDKVAEKPTKTVTKDLEAFRKLKRRAPLRLTETKSEQENISDPKTNSEEIIADKNKNEESLSDIAKSAATGDEENKLDETAGVEQEKEKMESNIEKQDADEDKSTDLEIVIDLDDYPDDMEDMDAGEKKGNKSAPILKPEERKPLANSKPDSVKTGNEVVVQKSAETWATRYYQTEDVQSVIKESKIQSEIRKRLRERQRLARLNNSPNLNSVSQSVSTAMSTSNITVEKNQDNKVESITATTGSVEEYLALKNVETVSTTDNLTADDSATKKEASSTEINSEIVKPILKIDEKLIDEG